MASLLTCVLTMILALPATARGQERFDERHPLRSDALLEVEAVAHSIQVEPWDREEVRITGTLNPETQRLEVTGDAGSLTVRIVHERDERNARAGTLEVRAPEDVRLTVSSVSGSVEVRDLSGSLRVSSTSGRILVTGAPSSARVNAVSGDIEVNAAVPELRFNAVSGSVRITGVRGRVDGQAVSGDVHIEAGGPLEQMRVNSVSGQVEVAGELGPEGEMEVQSHSGSVQLRLPEDTPAAYEIQTMSGTIRNSITDDSVRSRARGPGRSLEFRVGEATARIRLNTFSGSVSLEPLR